MPTPTDRNARIALANGWTWHKHDFFLAPDFGNLPELRTHWLDSEGEPAMVPDFVGTLEGVSGMLRELHEAGRRCSWSYNIHTHKYICIEDTEFFDDDVIAESPEDHPGDCVGDAWLSVKEAADGS